MSLTKAPAVALLDRPGTPNNEIAKLILAGYGADRIASALNIDYDTARRRCRDVMGYWATQNEDPSLVRAMLCNMGLELYQDSYEFRHRCEDRQKAAALRASESVLQALLDLTGLRRMTVNVNDARMAAVLSRLSELGYPGRGGGSVPPDVADVVEGRWSVVSDGEGVPSGEACRRGETDGAGVVVSDAQGETTAETCQE